MVKITPFRLRRIVIERGAFYARRIPALRARLVERFAADLRYLHDTLESTEISGHYWVWSGLLLGWARERAILAHDSMDADFAVDDRDFHLLARSIPALVKAGFSPSRCFVNNDGVITELTFTRHGNHFDFFRMFPVGDKLHYFMYSIQWNEILEFEACVPKQEEKAPFSFIGRTWLKQEDHERELQAMYGSWQIPDPTWSYLDTPDMVARRVSRHRHFDWPGGAEDLPAELLSPSSVGADEPDTQPQRSRSEARLVTDRVVPVFRGRTWFPCSRRVAVLPDRASPLRSALGGVVQERLIRRRRQPAVACWLHRGVRSPVRFTPMCSL